MNRHLRLLIVVVSLLSTLVRGKAAVVINEIMFHPLGAPAENPAQEWIEIVNTSTTDTVNVSGWKLTKGVSFTIPTTPPLTPGAFLVIAADVTAFGLAHPGFAGTVVGGWTGNLAGGGEQIQLDDLLGVKMSDVTYADEGDWAVRGRGVLSFSHKGWSWFNDADGGGKTIELRNAALGNGSGQNWGVSVAVGGTPGAVNTLAAADVAPLIKDVKHRPQIPRTTDPIVVSCNLENETAGATATLRWRVDGASTFNTLAMTDTDGDGDVEATIPAQAVNLTVIEWYISATDGTFTRTWPAPARTSDPGVLPETFGQVTNALVQVDNAFVATTDFTVAGSQPIYRLIMTNTERAELATIGSTSGQQQSEATMNGTFISHDGTGLDVVYNAGFRNRGFSSALGPPNNFNVSFRSDDLWNGRSSFALNCQYGYSQALGNTLFDRAGIAPQETAVVRARVNGVDLAETGARMYGRYARIEGRGGAWAERHYPNDPDGNFYRLDDHAYSQGDPLSGEFRYEGSDPALYSDTFIKETNQDANDYSDLINLARIVSAPDTGGNAAQPAIPNAAYPAAVAAVLDVDQFYRFIATDALVGNREGGLQSGRADDVSLYRGVIDPRFRFVPHDLDDVFAIGNGIGDSVTRSIFSYDISGGGLTGLPRMFNHPQLVPRYYAAVLEALNSWFTSANVDPVIDQLMSGWVPASNGASVQSDSIAEIKAYVAARRANVLAQIQQNYSLSVTAGGTAVDGNPRTNDGAATFSGTFNVAKTYSITVNGVLATWSYRGASAGTWTLAVAAGGGSVLSPGLNAVIVRFLDATGGIVKELTTKVLWQPVAASYTNVSGTLAPAGSIAMTAPASYIPGIPFLVKMDLKDGAGNLDRTAWNRTATLTATNGVTLNPATVTLTNGMGSALVTVGSSGGPSTTQLIQPGGTLAVPNASAPDWRMLYTATADPAATWKSDQAFADGTWALGKLQAGAGDSDERTNFTAANVDTALTTRRAFYFRKIFNVTNSAAFTQLQFKTVIDDGAVFYLNGTEVYRVNMPAGTPTLTTPATTNVSGTTTPSEADIRTIDISAFLNLLVAGNNLLAVEIHNFSNATTNSADLSFDCELSATTPGGGSDPGNFTLTGTVGTLSANKAFTSLTPTPTMTNVSGALPAGTTNWSGVIHMTGDVTVPSGATLNIAAGTHVLVDGTPFVLGTAAVDQNGVDLIVNGLLNAPGTLANPISISCSAPANRWGRLAYGSGSLPSTLQYCLISRSGHSPEAGGHIPNSGGQMVLLTGGTLTIDDSVLADGVGKTMVSSASANLTIRRSHVARFTMGPELDGSKVTIQDSNFTEMLPAYRERGAADDEDCLYIHDSGDPVLRPVRIERTVFSNSGDDGIDLLAGTVTVEDCIIRNIFDKGMSLLRNDVTVRRTQIVDCDFCISTKTSIGTEATPYTLTLENCTLVGEVHPTNQGDQTGGVYWHSVGVHIRNKYGTGLNPKLFVVAKNCIISAVTPMLNDYAANTDPPESLPRITSTYNLFQDVAGTNPVDPVPPAGTGDATADPLFVDADNKDFHLTSPSPARDTGDPASPLDADGSRADKGALPYGATVGGAGTLTWTPAGGPYRVTASTTVPANLTLTIQAGTAVYFDQNVKLTVNGTIKVLGTQDKQVVVSNVPGTTATDPITLIAGQPAKWAGIVVVGPAIGSGPAITGSEFRYCTFLNAQPAMAAGNTGSLGIIRAFALIDHCIFLGTHLRQVYGENCALQVQYCTFVDPFDPLNDADNPTAAPNGYGLDNIAEPLKVANANNADPNYAFGLPVGGYFRVWYNEFRGNKGHNDVFDADSGGFNAAAGVNNTNPILDCRYNNFLGQTGDEHIDLGGDAYIANNIFQRGHKDKWTNDHGYSNCISSGDKSGATTIWVARNIAFNVDHVMNCKASTATIFENNTVANFSADFAYTSTTIPVFTQDVKCSAINQYVPDDSGPTRGDGAYIAGNIFHNIPRVVTWADLPATLATKLEAANNYLNGITDNSVGPITAQFSGGTLHPGGFTALGAFVPPINQPADPQFVNEAGGNYALKATSPARGTAPGGLDYGASIAEWIHITGGPLGSTDQTTANFTISGPAMVAYKWRLDGGAWSAVQAIGNGLIFPRGATPTVRSATLALTSLTAGAHTLEVIGRDPAGNWQDTDLARTVGGLPPNAPTARTWTVDLTNPIIRINEVLAESATLPDTIELVNLGTTPVNIGGWTLSDDPLVPAKYTIPANTMVAPGAFVTFTSTTTAISLDRNGDAVYLHNGATLVDSIAFGNQITDLTIGRSPVTGAWTLCTNNGTPSTVGTFGAANVTRQLGDPNVARISEWFTSGDVLYDADWIELVNPGPLPIDIGGLHITDNRAGDPQAHTFAALTFIPANGYARFIADGTTSQGPSHLSFSLDAQQENIALLSAVGTQLDAVFFYPQTTDRSMGRDAGGNLVFYELPTRGFLNGTTDPAYANALEILRHLRISEIMYNAIGGPDFDYIELTNTGATPLALGGVSFVQGITFTFPAMALNPGECVVVVKTLSRFRSRYGNTPVVAGSYTGQLDNGGEFIGLQLPPPFDANTLTFAYSDTWYLSTDGLGTSLVIPNALVNANVWGDKDTWLASAANGGNPCGVGARTDTYSGFSVLNAVQAITDDIDRDSIGALMEFSLGQDITNPNGYFGVAGLPVPGRAGDGRATLTFFVPEVVGAVQGHGWSDITYRVQAADILGTWTNIATKTFSASWTGTAAVGAASGGYVPITITDTAPGGGPPRYLRLQVNWTP